MAIAKTTSGLLARNEAGNATYPFSAAAVDLPANVTAAVNGASELELTSTVNADRFVRFNDFTAASSMFVQHLWKVPQPSGTGGTTQVFTHSCVNVEDHTAGSEDLYYTFASLGLGSGGLVGGSLQVVAGSHTYNAVYTTAALKTWATQYRTSMRSSGRSTRALDFTSNIE